MQDIIVNIVVAAAILFLIAWAFRNFVSKKTKQPECGSCCPECAEKKAQGESGVHEHAHI